jgi:hypothetical protein
MPYDLDLADLVRSLLRRRHDVIEKKMFGGLAFLLSGNLCVAIWNDSLIARVGAEGYAEALESPHTREFDLTGRPMRGWVVVEPEGVETASALEAWVARCVKFAAGLPEK